MKEKVSILKDRFLHNRALEKDQAESNRAASENKSYVKKKKKEEKTMNIIAFEMCRMLQK